MRLKYGEAIIESATDEDAIEQMRAQAFEPTRTVYEFMKQAAQRAQIQTGVSVRVDSSSHFIKDLVSAGLVEVC